MRLISVFWATEVRAKRLRFGECASQRVERVADVSTGEGVTFSQMERVVVKFLQDNPKKLNLNQSTLVVKALSKAFPCLKKK